MRRSQLVLAVVTFSMLLSPQARSQSCAPGAVPNFSFVSGTAQGFTLAWTHPAGRGQGTTYEIVRENASGWCPFESTASLPLTSILTTTSTTASVTFSPPNSVVCYFVQVADCPQIRSDYCFLGDTLPLPPASKPNLISAVATGVDRVTLTYSHPDDRTIGLALDRAPFGGSFQEVVFGLPMCPPGTVRSVVDDGTSVLGAAFRERPALSDRRMIHAIDAQLAPGTYAYRLVARTNAGGEVYSDVKTVTLGSGGCVPLQVPPQISASSTNVVVDQQVALSWTTTENPDRFLIQFSADANFTNLRSFSVAGASRSVNFRFPDAGTFFLRIIGVNSCGQREGNRLTFNVAPPPPRVVVTAQPSGMLQVVGENQNATDNYTLANLGGTATTIQLNQPGQFFVQTPSVFTLGPGQNQTVTLQANPQSTGNFIGASIPTGSGVPPGLVVPVRLIAATRPSADPTARAAASRIDLAASEGQTPTGTVEFTAAGAGTVKGVLASNVPWIVFDDQFVNLPPGETGTFRFHVDRALRANSRGSETATIALHYMQGPSGKISGQGSTPPPGSKTTLITVSDTVKPPVTPGAIPPVALDEVAYFVPGVGHVQGGAGLFISDVTILNAGSAEDLNDLKIYFVPGGGSGSNAQLTTFTQISSNQSLGLADVTKSVFNSEGTVGSLQVRAKAVNTIGINANIFNTSNPSGTYGTTLPVFSSANALGANEKLFLAGLRKDASGRTNIYLQETTGQTATATVQFLNSAGTVLGTSAQTVQPFALNLFLDPLPLQAVAAVVTNNSTNGARLLAHATPVDQLTGDTWSVADWSRQYGYSTSGPMVIPVAGKLRGANNSDFRTDVAIMNTGTTSAGGTLRYHHSGGAAVDRVLTLGPQETRLLTDVVGTLFGISTTSVGYMIFTPSSGTFVVTSRTYTLAGDGVSTFGTGVPTVASAANLEPGEVRKISGIQDSTSSTVVAATPGTFRTNLGLAETAGQAVTVRATMRYTAVQGAAAAVGVASTDIPLQPRQLLLESSITTRILGANRALFGELRDIQVDFEIVGTTGNVVVFTTSTDNGTNDTALRVE